MKQIYAEYAPLDGEVQDGDMLKVSYESDFALPENAAPALARAVKADESWLHIIEPEQIPGMNAALKGGVKGGEYTFTAEFPADWRQEELRGAKVNYKVKINDGQRKVELKDDQALADKMKIESVEKMMENFRTMAENELKGETAEKKQTKLLETLLEKTPAFTLPESMVAEVTQREFNRLINQLVRSQEDVEEFKKNQEQHLADAKKAAEDYVRKFFIVRTIAKAEGIEVSKEELDAQIRMMCMYTGRKEEEVRKQLEQGNGLSEINEDLLIGKTLHTVAEKIWA
jgi:trigger factor